MPQGPIEKPAAAGPGGFDTSIGRDRPDLSKNIRHFGASVQTHPFTFSVIPSMSLSRGDNAQSLNKDAAGCAWRNEVITSDRSAVWVNYSARRNDSVPKGDEAHRPQRHSNSTPLNWRASRALGIDRAGLLCVSARYFTIFLRSLSKIDVLTALINVSLLSSDSKVGMATDLVSTDSNRQIDPRSSTPVHATTSNCRVVVVTTAEMEGLSGRGGGVIQVNHQSRMVQERDYSNDCW